MPIDPNRTQHTQMHIQILIQCTDKNKTKKNICISFTNDLY